MIIREKDNWLRLLFVWHGSVLPQILPRLLALLVLSVGVVLGHGQLMHYKVPLTAAPFTLFGVTLAIFLGFYNNASYDRFWEGRKQWGALLNTTRSLARQALTLSSPPGGEPAARPFVRLLIAFTYALKHQLRHTDPAPDLTRLLPAPLAQAVHQATYRPMLLLLELGRWVQQGRKAGQLDTTTQLAFDHNFNQLSDIVGGCERLAGTPIPYTYSVMLHRTVYLYCFLLPFGLVDSTGWLTPLIVVFVAYTFMALDAIMREIEEPFGTGPNDLALNTMSHMIEATLLELAGEALPPAPEYRSRYMFD
ncbi:bestrophin family protein [Hymenobacter baengnokdamensis]|uniref:bestrophin family protein n=1 Tax=Hymenobacter baengnokdamensis TaxID=2615203 RepID=UPI0012459F69|nr:bestrophin family ion channel [Hymenobacter baengnokdamensis]